MTETGNEKRILNRETIKFITIVLMTMNHYAWLFLKPGTVVCELFTGLGYATAISMCYFLAEGFRCTRSRKKYALRLAFFGLISQVPFSLLYTFGKHYMTLHFNMIWTLFLCFILMIVLEEVPDRRMRLGLVIAIIVLSSYFDWAILAPVYTILFYRAGNDKKAVRTAFFTGIALLVFNLISNYAGTMPPLKVAQFILLDITGPLLATAMILLGYNGEQASGSRIWKWFFYLYYPVHLLVLVYCYKTL